MDTLLRAIGQATSQIVGRIIGRRLTSRELSAEESLTPEQMIELGPRMTKVRGRLNRFEWLCAGATIIALVAPLLVARAHVEPDPLEPVVDTRSRWPVIALPLCALFAAGFITAIAARVYLRKRMGDDVEMYYRFEATRTGRHLLRQFWVIMILLPPLAVFMGWAGWNLGETVDQRGMTWQGGFWGAEHRTYENVATIELYQKVDAPIGIVERANLRITFTDGAEMRLDLGGKKRVIPRLQEIAEYISDKSAVPIMRGVVRP